MQVSFKFEFRCVSSHDSALRGEQAANISVSDSRDEDKQEVASKKSTQLRKGVVISYHENQAEWLKSNSIGLIPGSI